MKQKNDHGFILITALFLLIIISFVITTASYIGTHQSTIYAQMKLKIRSHFLAEAMWQHALEEVQSTSCSSGSSTTPLYLTASGITTTSGSQLGEAKVSNTVTSGTECNITVIAYTPSESNPIAQTTITRVGS